MINQPPNTSWFSCPTNASLICCECGKSTRCGTYELEHLDSEKVHLTGRTLCNDCADQNTLAQTYLENNSKAFWMTHVMIPRVRNEH